MITTKIMKTQITNIKLVIIFLIAVFTGCNKDAVVENLPEEYKVKIISPADGANFAKHEEIKFEASLLLGNDTITYDNILWDINNDHTISLNPRFNRIFDVGEYKITCKVIKENKLFVDSINITVENKVVVDTLYIDDNFTFYKFINNSRILCIDTDKNDNLIVGTGGTGLYISNNNMWVNYDINDGLFQNSIQTITPHGDEIYIGYYDLSGILKISANGLQNININNSYDEDVHKIIFDKENNLWAALHYGTVINNKNGRWNSLNTFPNQDVDFHHPNDFAFDSKGVLWGSSDYGAIKFDGQNWDSVFVNGELLRSLCMEIDAEDNIWFADHGHVYRINDTDTLIYNSSNTGLQLSSVWDLEFDSKNNLWLGTKNGLVKFDGTSWESIQLPVDAKSVNDLAIDSNDIIWFSVNSWELEFFAFGFYKN